MKMMASTEGAELEDLCVEELCLEDKVDALALSVGMIHKKMDRLLAMLDSKENKKMKDRVRIKQKRDEENAAQAVAAGKIVVDRLEGTMHTDPRLPYKRWAYIMLEFGDANEFLRWLMNEYLESYYCIRDSRRRMIVRKGNHWKIYKKGCGTEALITPADMFGGQTMHWDKMLDLVCLRWCHVHVRPILEHVCNLDRLVHVHQHHKAWNAKDVNTDCGPPLPLESRWWKKSARFREKIHATLGVYGEGWIRTSKGSMLIDYDEIVLKRREVQAVYKDIARALYDGVSNRTGHAKWMEASRLQKCVDRGIEAHKVASQADAHARFLKSLHEHRARAEPAAQSPMQAVRMGVELAAAAKEEHDMQKAIQASLGATPLEEKRDS